MNHCQNIIQKGNDIYLLVNGEWYVYNRSSTPLGAGAMGTVYIGKSCSRPSQKVAIKVLVPQYCSIPSIRERARLEGSLLFRHPNLVEMVGVCEYAPDKGPIFIISHLVQGINLDVHVKQNLRALPNYLERICKCMYPVLDALEYLHDKNIYHLDVKPSNIMIENGCNIRLMDLGIASAGNANSAQIAGMVGTPQYAAPEQCAMAGQQEQIDGRTDIYEAGVTLYELLTQTNPYNAATINETMKLHRSIILPYVKDIPHHIIDVLRVATDPEQDRRYATAHIFKEELMNAFQVKEKFSFRKLFRN